MGIRQHILNELGTWDFASMAAGMGGDGHLVRTRAQPRAALELVRVTRGRFQLLDIRLQPGAQSPGLVRVNGRIGDAPTHTGTPHQQS